MISNDKIIKLDVKLERIWYHFIFSSIKIRLFLRNKNFDKSNSFCEIVRVFNYKCDLIAILNFIWNAWLFFFVVVVVVVQFITFGFACTPLYFVWEKFIGMHNTKSIYRRALARLPVVIPIWFLAIIFPFFGPINSTVGSLLVSFTVYIIPSLAHMITFASASAREVKYFDSFLFFN